MLPVISGDCRRGGDGERSIDANEREEGGAGRAWERFGRERIRGSLPPGVGVNGSSIFGVVVVCLGPDKLSTWV
jgi:hypothetical protein